MSRDDGSKAFRRNDAAKLTGEFRGILVYIVGLSGIINVLALTGAFYMLQIYDRALGSGNIPTLLAISALAIGLYLFQGVFDIVRSQILVRIGARMDKKFSPIAHEITIDMPRYGFSTSEALERGRDVDTMRGFMGTQGPIALFDLPWMPLFLAFVYFLHPLLGALTIAGAFVLTILTVITELMTRRLSNDTQKAAIARNRIADSNARNSEILKAMGMGKRAIRKFVTANDEHLQIQTRTSDIGGTLGAMSRVLRMILQSAVLGLGAYLTIVGQLSPGAIIAASVAAARALAPVDMAIANWKQVVAARAAFARLKETAQVLSKQTRPMQLPAPKRRLSVENVTIAAPGSGTVLISDVSFELKAGEALGIIGPSGGGKTTLVRALTAIWPCLRGNIRLDNADLAQWSDEDLGQYIGYLPQDVALIDGTVSENISRLENAPDPEKVVAAARAAGVHEMIVRLPEGYGTNLGAMGTALSGGQRQRIGLARALYGDPFLVVLDEPNSNLDGEGEAALTEAIRAARQRGAIVILVAHRPSALAAVDLVAVMQNGRLTAFGPKEEIIKRQGNKSPAVAAAPARTTAAVAEAPVRAAEAADSDYMVSIALSERAKRLAASA